MRLGITAKLFLAILLTCVIASFAMLGAMRYSFHHGFLGYLNEQEAQRVESVLPKLAAAYRQHGNWDFVRDKPRLWFSLIRPEGMPDFKHHRPSLPPPPLPDSEFTGLMMRFSLLDAQKQLVIGNHKLFTHTPMRPIEVNGQVVGWIAWMPLERAITNVAVRFHERQAQSGWIIVVIAIVLAALVAWLLARIFLAPLKRITASTHSLAAGDYAARVPVSSGDELGQLGEDFNRLALTLEKNENLRRNFMADISHELRTPLAVLKGELEAVEDGIRPMSLASIRSLQTEVGTLGKLVDDLYQLSLSDVGALAYRKNRVDVLAILMQTIASFEERFADKAIRVDLRFDTTQAAHCNADPLRLQQMFSNLLENAHRYTDAGGVLEICCTHDDELVRIDFQDSAPGVPADKLPHLFERFYRADHSRSRATGGSGLGLAISRNIAEAHQGGMRAQASPLGGLWISVALPLAGKETA
ncbi:MAG: baeS [Burkholderiaceae bacterium]|nr:baeS [Burkholderiaceae bacterium]